MSTTDASGARLNWDVFVTPGIPPSSLATSLRAYARHIFRRWHQPLSMARGTRCWWTRS